jgi:(R)-2-hydroxyacyl-CoA dehydratese activating ATPase
MRCAGIDIGSRAIKFVITENGSIIHSEVVDTGFDPLDRCKKLLSDHNYDSLVATGYGRHLLDKNWDQVNVITEIKAAAIGAREVLPSCRTIIDIGGQDTKVISLDQNGKMFKFNMNDRCAAGTGRFLEVMATALSLSREDFIEAAYTAEKAEKISSMCTVFAESEVVSLVARGKNRDDIALGIHHSISTRTIGLLKTIPIEEEILFVGGGALNSCLKREMEDRLKKVIFVSEQPQIAAALGCAIQAKDITVKSI